MSLAWERVREASWPVALASVGAALAWWFAHDVLGHAQPFFAPIAAAITLSSSRIQRWRRTVQLVGGVLLGIAVGELLSSAFGTGAVTLGAITFVTMMIAVAIGAGVVGEGMLFVNQAAASAILVVALHKHGTGAERAVDAFVGGAVALLLGVLLFPAEPLTLLADAERAVLSALVDALRGTANHLERGAAPDPMWPLDRGHVIHQLLARLIMARAIAQANARIAPRRWRVRQAVAAEAARTAQLDLLGNAVLSLVRAATREQMESNKDLVRSEIVSLASALALLADADRPWSLAQLDHVRASADSAIARTRSLQAERTGVVSSILASVAIDIKRVIEVPEDVAE
jgi:uncharacterized membrane protein YgaE (UPF0421/DUF939 family)